MPHEDTSIERPCPQCLAGLVLKPADQVHGRILRCLHCNAELMVERDYDALQGYDHIVLVDADDELPEPGA